MIECLLLGEAFSTLHILYYELKLVLLCAQSFNFMSV